MLASVCERQRGWLAIPRENRRTWFQFGQGGLRWRSVWVEIQTPGLSCGELDIVDVMDVSLAAGGQLAREKCGMAKSQRQEGASSREA